MRNVALLLFAVCTLSTAGSLAAQAAPTPAAVADSGRTDAVRAFLDCQSAGCDFDFMRDQIRWATWVRDRLVADVQLLVTSLRTGSGGTEYTVTAIGLERYKGRADTVVVFTNPNDAADVVRRQLARTFSLLLAPYAAKTPLAAQLTVTYAAPSGSTVMAQPKKDRWNFWVYRISGNGYTNGEKSSTSLSLNVNASANRVTAAWKLNVNSNYGYSESKYSLGSEGTFVNLQRNYSASTLAVKSLGDHLSAGLSADASSSDFLNQKLSMRIAPAIEYNIFPYKDFTRRQLTLFYSLGVQSFRYKELTLDGQVDEIRPVHNMNVSWNAKQQWGSLNIGLFGSQYLHDLNRYNYGASGNVSLRISKGLSINLGGYASRVADQLYLPRRGLTDQQIIARQQALATNFRYFGNFGVSYTFGSIFNNVVNPRFGGSGGQTFFF